MAKKSSKKSASTPRRAAVKKGSSTVKKTGARSVPTTARTKRTPTKTAPTKASAKPKPTGSGSASPALAEGMNAPAFRLDRDGGKTVSLGDFAGRKLVIYFYPRADTPGCTREAMDFTRLRGEFAKANTDVIGISADPPKAQDAFRDKYELAIPLASDESKRTIEAYGAWGEKSLYGRTFEGILRTTVLVGADGRIARIWRRVKVDGHAEDVLAAARATAVP